MPFKNRQLNENIDRGETVEFTVQTLNIPQRRKFNYIIMKYLTLIDRLFYLNPVVTVFNELLDNAIRANMKRVEFDAMELDIHNPDDYKKGIENFSRKFHTKRNIVEKYVEGSEYNTLIRFELNRKNFTITIINNSEITGTEMERIRERFSRGSEERAFLDVHKDVSDISEGAGMGIALSVFMLKSIGLSPEAVKIGNNKGYSITQLNVPLQALSRSTAAKIKKKIIEEVNQLPTFPENIVKLRDLCRNPESSIDSITEIIQKDPVLTAEVVKISNTSKFLTSRRVYNVNDALLTIGLKRLNQILIAVGTRSILDERYPDMEAIWEHSNRVAFYAVSIAKDYNLKVPSEEVLIAGLLHDIGRVIFAAFAPDLVKSINSITNYKKNFPATSLEEAALGVSHESVGGLIASRWNFPDYLIESIRYHHNPLVAGEIFREVVYIVYLANMLCGIEERKYEYYYIDYAVLLHFELTEDEELEKYHEKLNSQYSGINE